MSPVGRYGPVTRDSPAIGSFREVSPSGDPVFFETMSGDLLVNGVKT
jgi:hypothetical protein